MFLLIHTIVQFLQFLLNTRFLHNWCFRCMSTWCIWQTLRPAIRSISWTACKSMLNRCPTTRFGAWRFSHHDQYIYYVVQFIFSVWNIGLLIGIINYPWFDINSVSAIHVRKPNSGRVEPTKIKTFVRKPVFEKFHSRPLPPPLNLYLTAWGVETSPLRRYMVSAVSYWHIYVSSIDGIYGI